VAVGGGETAYVSESRNVKIFRHDPDFFPSSANAGRAAHIVCQELLTDPNSRMALGADTMRILRMVMSPGRVATGARCGRGRAAHRRSRGSRSEEYSVQGQSARSDHLPGGSGLAHTRRRLILFPTRASRHPRRSNRRTALRINRATFFMPAVIGANFDCRSRFPGAGLRAAHAPHIA
jgi:hypothetical protein